MKKFISVLNSVVNVVERLYAWAKRQTEFYIAIMSGLIWFLFWFFLGENDTYPVGYFQKIAFGILAMSIISGVAFFWLRKTQPYYYDLIDPNTQGGINDLTTWEKVKVGLFWFSFFAGGTVLLASLY